MSHTFWALIRENRGNAAPASSSSSKHKIFLDFTASDGQAGDAFGYSLALDGHWAIVGAPQDDDKGLAAGAAYFYYFDNGQWIEHQKLTADDGSEADLFGRWVTIEGPNWSPRCPSAARSF